MILLCQTWANSVLYVTSTGCDYGLCSTPNTNYSSYCSLPMQDIELFDTCCQYYEQNTTILISQNTTPTPILSTCNTIDYTLRCLLGTTHPSFNTSHQLGSSQNAYHGQGIIEIGSGSFDINSTIGLIDDNHISLYGQSITNTTLTYYVHDNNISIFNCSHSGCHFQISNVKLSFNFISTSVDKYFEMSGATVIFDNVVFEGIIEMIHFVGFNKCPSPSIIHFNNCTFFDNDATFLFDNVNATFTNCIFLDNPLTDINRIALLVIEGYANVSFIDCTFRNDQTIGIERSLIHATSGILYVQNTDFIDLARIGEKLGPFHGPLIGAYSTSGTTIKVMDSIFKNITGFFALIYSSSDAKNSTIKDIIILSRMTVNGSSNSFDFFSLSNTQNFSLLESRFINGILLGESSLYITTAYSYIENTVWENYSISVAVIWKYMPGDHGNHYNGIIMRRINGGCISIFDASSPISISNSIFDEVTTLQMNPCWYCGLNKSIS